MRIKQLVKIIGFPLYPLVVICDYLVWNFMHPDPEDSISFKQSWKGVWEFWIEF